MNITITFRHMESSSAVKAYAGEKVSKLQKFLRQPMNAKVTLAVDKLVHIAEARISSGGEHLEAREQTGDMYESIDKMIDKLERQIRGNKGAKESRTRRTSRNAPPPVEAEAAPAAPEPVRAPRPAPRRAAPPTPARKVTAKKVTRRAIPVRKG